MFLKFFVPPATLLPPPALEMDTRDVGVTFVCSVVKLKLLKFDARSRYFERASYSETCIKRTPSGNAVVST